MGFRERLSRREEAANALLEADVRGGSDDWGTHTKYKSERDQDGRRSKKPKVRGGGQSPQDRVRKTLDITEFDE